MPHDKAGRLQIARRDEQFGEKAIGPESEDMKRGHP